MLINGLPPDAAVWREETAWTFRDELAATQIEITDIWFRNLFVALGGKPKGKPIRIERPKQGEPEKQSKRTNDPAVIAGFFAKHIS